MSLTAFFANLVASTSRGLIVSGLHTTAPLAAAAKKKATPAKKKSTVKKASSGPRSTGSKRKVASNQADAAGNRQNPFFQALRAPKLPTLTPGACSESNVGRALAWGKIVRELIKTAQVPRALLKEFSEQATPRTLLRSTALSLAATLDKAAQPDLVNLPSPRQLLVGPRGCGKSHLLLQSVAYALDEGWAVAYIPRCISLVDSTSSFVYTPAQQVYAQPLLAQHLARSLAAQKCIADLPLLQESADAQDAEASAAIKSQRELAVLAKTCGELAKAAAADTVAPAIRVAAIELLLRSLAAQTQVPFLLAIDDVQALYMRSAYRDADFAFLEAWELALPRSILHLLRSEGPKRGAVLAATGESATEWKATPAFRQAIGVAQEAVHFKRTVPLNDYTPVDQTHLRHALEAHWEKIEVPKLTQTEAKGLWEVRCLEGGHWSNANDELYLLKLLESGGNIKVFERSLTQTTL